MPLTAKQEMFVQEYLVDLNGKQAAIRCGYSEKTAENQASRLLSNDKVAVEVQKQMDKRSEKVGITAERVLTEIAHSAFVDPAKYFDEHGKLITITDMPEEVRRSIASIKVRREKGDTDENGKQLWDTVTEIKVNDKSRNLELLGKHLKLFTEKHEHTGEGGGAIKYQNATEEEIDKRVKSLMAETSDEP